MTIVLHSESKYVAAWMSEGLSMSQQPSTEHCKQFSNAAHTGWSSAQSPHESEKLRELGLLSLEKALQ